MGSSNLQKRLQVVHKAVEQLPTVAAETTEKLMDQDQAAQRAPDGSRWVPTKAGAAAKGAVFDEKAQRYRIRGRFATGAQLRPFDPGNHIRYEVAVRNGQVVLESSHPAAAFTRWGTKKMPARPKVPGAKGGAAWFPKILQALRRWHGRAA